jgi:hypothetical protein
MPKKNIFESSDEEDEGESQTVEEEIQDYDLKPNFCQERTEYRIIVNSPIELAGSADESIATSRVPLSAARYLMGHQQEGVRRMWDAYTQRSGRSGFILADDMVRPQALSFSLLPLLQNRMT